MTAQENKALVLRTLDEVFVRKNPDAILEADAENVVLHVAGFPEPVVGRRAVRDWVAAQLAAFDTEVTVEDALAEGDLVVLRSTMRLLHKGEYLGIPATGRRLTYTQIEMVRFEGGQIRETWISLDTLGVMQQLGVFPAGRPPRALLDLVIGIQRLGRRRPTPAGPSERHGDRPAAPPARLLDDPPVTDPVAASNKATALCFVDQVFEKRQAGVVREIVAPGAVFHLPGYPEPVRGPEGLEAWASAYLAAFDSHLEVHEAVAVGDLVALRFTVRGTHVGGGYLGIPPTGRRVEFTEFSLTRYADGKAQEGWLMLDTLEVMQQLGLFPKGQPPRALLRLAVALQRRGGK